MILSYFFGTSSFHIRHSFAAKALNTLAANDIQYVSLCADDNGSIDFRVPLYRKKRVASAFNAASVEYEHSGNHGFPATLARYRKRWGIAAGVMIFFTMCAVSPRVIWSVSVTGNDTVSEKEISAQLSELGCGVGDLIDKIDFDMLHNEFLIRNPSISWISVNMDGTRANVEVRETFRGTAKADSEMYNIVAGEDGQIEQMAEFEGKPQVKLGGVVRRGDLLISGIITYKENGVRFESADGEVFARVYRSFDVEIPGEITEKVLTGSEIDKTTLVFFKFRANLFINSSIPYEKYDTIRSERQMCLFDRVSIPVWIETDSFSEYEMQTRKLGVKEAKAIADAEYTRLLRETLGSGRLLSKSVSRYYGDDGVYRISCSLYCIDNIAVKVPLSIDNKESENP